MIRSPRIDSDFFRLRNPPPPVAPQNVEWCCIWDSVQSVEQPWLACKSAHDRTVWTDKKTGEKTQDVSRDLPEQTYHYVINSKRVLMKAPDSNEYIVDGDLDEKKTPEIGPSTTSTYFLRISPDTIKFG